MFSQIRTRAMIHETTGIMPCRGGGDGLLHIAFSEGLNGNPTQIALMDIVAKRPSPLTPYSRESADNAVRRVSTGGLAITA
jgi:hypothetical protein